VSVPHFPEEAVAALQKAISLSGGSISEVAALGHVYGMAGRQAEAPRVIEELNARSGQRHVSGFNLALVYAGRGMAPQAIDLLYQGYQERHSQLPYISVDPRFDGLRSEPRFKDLLTTMNLPT
jgi:hypothetical protein